MRLETSNVGNETAQNRTKQPIKPSGESLSAGGAEARCTLVFTGFVPRALVAQRIEQKTSNLLAAGSIPAEGTNELLKYPVNHCRIGMIGPGLM